jgi:hypothetical protein
MASLGAATHLSKPKASILGMIGAASLLCVAAPSAKAADFTPVFTLPNPPNTITPDSTIRVFGYQFVTTIDRQVKSVGIYSPTATGHTVGIWEFPPLGASPILLNQLQVPAGNSCNLYQSFCWVNFPTTNLSASKNYAIAATWGASEPIPAQLNPTVGDATINVANFSLNNTAVTINPPLPSTYLVDLTPYVPAGTSGTDNKGYYTVNLSFDSAPSTSQVPAPLPLFGAAAAFGMSRKIRNRIRAAS